MNDFRYAARMLGRSPAFTAVAVMSLALGLGANTAVFSLLNAVVLRDLDVRRPEELVSVVTIRRDGSKSDLSLPMFEAFARDQRVFSAFIGYWGDGIFNVEADGVLVRGDVWAVTGNFHSELGVVPTSGRLLGDWDVNLQMRAPNMVAFLGHGLWQREFGGDRSIVGRTVKVEGVPFTIVGIGPKGFTGFGITSEPDVTIPLTAVPLITRGTSLETLGNPRVRWIGAVGRLRPGVSETTARVQLTALWPEILTTASGGQAAGPELDEFLATRLGIESAARGRDTFLRNRFTQPLYIVLGVAGLILLIACVNLASLMLSRAAARRDELAVRSALGASRWRLVRQMLIEGAMLSALAAGLALTFAAWTSASLKALMTRDYLVPSILNVSPDARVVAFTSLGALVATLVFSIAPALSATKWSLAARNARSVMAGGRLGRIFIVGEVALSVMLLMAVTLLVGTLWRLRGTDLGFRGEGVTIVQQFPRPDGYRNFDGDRYFPALLDRVLTIPGVADAALTRIRPADGPKPIQMIAPADAGKSDAVAAIVGSVGPRFFQTLDITLLAGRDFSWADGSQAPRVAIVSRSLAERLFARDVTVGRRIRIGTDRAKSDVEIVGVVGDARLAGPRDSNRFSVYMPMLQDDVGGQWGSLLIRAGRSPIPEGEVRRVFESMGHEYVIGYKPLRQLSDRGILQERVTAVLAGFFGALALGLATIGLYGLMVYTIAQRTRELAVRMALGAPPIAVLAMVVREALALVVTGILIGLPLAFVGGWLVRSLLFGLTPADPLALSTIVVLLLVVGLVAGYVPGRRASRIEPMDALRV